MSFSFPTPTFTQSSSIGLEELLYIHDTASLSFPMVFFKDFFDVSNPNFDCIKLIPKLTFKNI
jgi:hypothetical protein